MTICPIHIQKTNLLHCLGVKGVVSSCFKQLISNLNVSLELFHSSFGERTLFAV